MDAKMLTSFRLFHNLSEREVEKLLLYLDAKEKACQKGEIIFHAGQTTSQMGLVLEGSVTIESNDLWGNRTILSIVEKGSLFAETYALLQDEPMLVEAVANENCRILMMRPGSLKTMSSDGQKAMEQGTYTRVNPESLNAVNQASSALMTKYLTNLLRISSYKNLMLSSRSFHTSPRTIRGRVMSYLNSTALQKHSDSFDIPYNRQQLADYLNLERSALSKELGKMQRDGLISVRKNHFEIHESYD